jgi:hypothetical protein
MNKRTTTGIAIQGVKLTAGDVEVLLDRLHQPDCIVEAMTDVHPDDGPAAYEADEIEAAIETLVEVLRGQRILLRPLLIGIETEVLAEAIEGSVWLAMADNQYNDGIISAAKLARYERQLRAAAAKVEEITGRTLKVPTC